MFDDFIIANMKLMRNVFCAANCRFVLEILFLHGISCKMQAIKGEIMAHTIKVQMFGSFRMEFDGAPLIAEKMHRESQFNRLMQVMMHYSQTGISKDKLEEQVIGERDIDVPHTALRVIVYKTKQKLKQLGLPGENWIYLENGIYYWTKDIEVIEDAALFEKGYQEAEALNASGSEADTDRLLQLYLDTCYMYKGEFLASYTAETWVAAENKKYHHMFNCCVEHASEILREKKDWKELEKLGRFAARIEPFVDWEILTMEALVEQKRFDEASAFYSQVVDYYLQECGIYPSTRLMEMLDKYTNLMNHTFEILDNIQEKMDEHRKENRGGYECSFPVFKGIYQMSVRLTGRVGDNIYLMLCTLVDQKGNQIRNEDKTEELSEKLRESIAGSIRQSDAYTQYGRTQYLVLLTNVNTQNCELIQNRINHNFMEKCKKFGIKYRVNSVKCEL